MADENSRTRLLTAIHLGQPDRIPCCFMSFAALRLRMDEDRFAAARVEAEMGLDPMLFIPSASRPMRPDHPDLRGLPVHFDPRVETVEYREHTEEGVDFLYKEYHTPAGVLTTRVRLSEDWPHGAHIPFLDDYQVPRTDHPLIRSQQDLAALDYLLMPPSESDITCYQDEAARAHAFIQELPCLLAGGWGIGMDMANWLCGMQNLMMLSVDQPELVEELLERIYLWNLARMRVVLGGGVDLYIRRAWYEGVDFVTPRFYHRAILPRLKKEVELAHEKGVKFGYICSSGTAPLLDMFLEAGIDVLIGIDPVQGTHTDLPKTREKLGGKVCLWGGVSAAVTLEQGSESEIRSAVRRAIQTLGPDGFILSPVDNITVDVPLTWKNIDVLIDEWKKNV